MAGLDSAAYIIHRYTQNVTCTTFHFPHRFNGGDMPPYLERLYGSRIYDVFNRQQGTGLPIVEAVGMLC